MRCQSIHDRDGNNYRHARAQKREEVLIERAAQEQKWDQIYTKSMALAAKDNKNERK